MWFVYKKIVITQKKNSILRKRLFEKKRVITLAILTVHPARSIMCGTQ